jgi:hypothetical protein
VKTARPLHALVFALSSASPCGLSVEYALALELRHGDVGTASLPERCFVVARGLGRRRWLSRKPKLMGTLKLFIGEFLQASLDSFDGYGSHLRLRFAFSLRYYS